MQSLDSFPEFYGTWSYITAFTRALHLYLSWIRPIQSTPSHTNKINLNVTYTPTSSSFLWCFFPLDFLPVTFTRFPSPNSSYMLTPLILLILITLDEAYKSCRYSLFSFLHPPVTSIRFSPNILLSTLFSNLFSTSYALQTDEVTW
jgi:hypothetical protein